VFLAWLLTRLLEAWAHELLAPHLQNGDADADANWHAAILSTRAVEDPLLESQLVEGHLVLVRPQQLPRPEKQLEPELPAPSRAAGPVRDGDACHDQPQQGPPQQRCSHSLPVVLMLQIA